MITTDKVKLCTQAWGLLVQLVELEFNLWISYIRRNDYRVGKVLGLAQGRCKLVEWNPK